MVSTHLVSQADGIYAQTLKVDDYVHYVGRWCHGCVNVSKCLSLYTVSVVKFISVTQICV